MSDGVTVTAVRGESARPFLPDLARLRLAVFREWPYLYEGCFESEAAHLRRYAASPDALVALARAGDRVVGAATALPLAAEDEAVRGPLAAAGFAPERTLYAGESVLLAPWRGRGIGVRFFELREAHARALGFTAVAFCRVVREADDPRRPAGFAELDGFWRRRGYAPEAEVSAEFSWPEIGGTGATPKRMAFWTKRLA